VCMRWVDGWLGFCLGMMETCGMSRGMWLHESKGEKFIKCKKFCWGVYVNGGNPSPSFLSQAENLRCLSSSSNF